MAAMVVGPLCREFILAGSARLVPAAVVPQDHAVVTVCALCRRTTRPLVGLAQIPRSVDHSDRLEGARYVRLPSSPAEDAG